ncbi:MAG: tetratricopeptide repeat protein [Candidatus Gastranaerophilales bacterium]|nr:tetratricopeptide repeat protein [Candidatus Gastranaerophilales bacterium]
MTNSDLTQYLKRAFEYKAAGNFKQAIESLYKALEIEPESSEILSEIAGLYLELSNTEKAIRYYEQALLSEPSSIDIKFKLAKVYKQAGLITKALPLLRSICEEDLNATYIAEILNLLYLESDFEGVIEFYQKPLVNTSKNAKIHYYAGSSYLALGDNKTARELFQKSIQYDSSDYEIVYSCANLLYEEGNYKEAAETLLASPIAKTNHKTFYLLGEICIAQNNITEAINNYSKACKLNPRNALYYYSLATAYSLNGFFKEAEDNYHNAVKLSPNNLFYVYTLALVYYQTKQISKAKERINSILSINPHNENALVLKARIATDENDVVNAENILKDVLKKNPKNDYALYIRAQVFQKLGWWEKAIESINLAKKYKPDSMEYISEAVLYNFSAKNYSEAESLCKRLIELDERYIFAYIKLTEIYVAQRRFSEALENIEIILKYDINIPTAYIMKAKIYLANKLYEQAIEFARQAISLQPDNNEYYTFIADIYYENRQYKDALRYYKLSAEYDVSSAYIRYRAAKCSLALGNPRDAIADFSVAKRLDPYDMDLSMDYCNSLCDVHEYKSALEVLKQSLQYCDSEEKRQLILKKNAEINDILSKNMSGLQKFFGKFSKL